MPHALSAQFLQNRGPNGWAGGASRVQGQLTKLPWVTRHPASEASLWIDRQLPSIAGAARRLGHYRRIRPEWTDEVRLILGETIRLCLTPPRRRPAAGSESDKGTRQEGGPDKARTPALLTPRRLRY